jgi:hypothetical protein
MAVRAGIVAIVLLVFAAPIAHAADPERARHRRPGRLGAARHRRGLTKPALVRARLSRSGRRAPDHRRGSVRLRVAVRCPGVTPKNTRVTVF